MDFKKAANQAIIGALLFTIISVILAGEYTQEVWIGKGIGGLIFGAVYGVFLMIRETFIKK